MFRLQEHQNKCLHDKYQYRNKDPPNQLNSFVTKETKEPHFLIPSHSFSHYNYFNLSPSIIVSSAPLLIKVGVFTKSFVCKNKRRKPKIRKIPGLRKRSIYAIFSMKRFFWTSVNQNQSYNNYYILLKIN